VKKNRVCRTAASHAHTFLTHVLRNSQEFRSSVRPKCCHFGYVSSISVSGPWAHPCRDGEKEMKWRKMGFTGRISFLEISPVSYPDSRLNN